MLFALECNIQKDIPEGLHNLDDEQSPQYSDTMGEDNDPLPRISGQDEENNSKPLPTQESLENVGNLIARNKFIREAYKRVSANQLFTQLELLYKLMYPEKRSNKTYTDDLKGIYDYLVNEPKLTTDMVDLIKELRIDEFIRI